jgi:Rrf2 family protein
MLTKKAKYALKALIALTREEGKGPMLISSIARQEGIPKKFLEQILLELRNQGILQSQKGKGGGYFLGRPSYEITMGQVVRIIDGPLAPLPCVSQTAYRKCTECFDERTCGIRMVMKEVRDSTARILDGIRMSEVIDSMKSPKINMGTKIYK